MIKLNVLGYEFSYIRSNIHPFTDLTEGVLPECEICVEENQNEYINIDGQDNIYLSHIRMIYM